MSECAEPSYSDASVRCVRVVGHEGSHVGFDADGLVTLWRGQANNAPSNQATDKGALAGDLTKSP